MTGTVIFQVLLYFFILLLVVKPLGWYMCQVYENKPCGLDRILAPFERGIYRACSISPDAEMNWKTYLFAMLGFNLLGILFLYFMQRLQGFLPFNPQHFTSIAPDTAFNTAVSFVTNTDWQTYKGENSLSYLTQMLGLTVQNFLSAATGMVLLVATIRGIVRSETSNLGNFWVDMVRTTLYILLPIAIVLAITLSSLGVIQNLKPYQTVDLLQPVTYQETKTVTQQIIPMGPVASQEAIKQLGTNGGGFFGANSAHPFENPTPLTNFLECLAILLIPMALCYTYGGMVKDVRQGWMLLTSMLIILTPIVFVGIWAELAPNKNFTNLSIEQTPMSNFTIGGNMEGKETRFGVIKPALWSIATTATANGSLNSSLDSTTPIGELLPLWLLELQEVVFGGVGSGLYHMIIFVIMGVFVTGLMVGRTPEYLGKKIEPFEIKMASVAILLVPVLILVFSALTLIWRWNADTLNPGPHSFTEILYMFSSLINNNGSSIGGFNINQPFYNIIGGIGVLIGRYWTAIPVLAIAGSLARKKIIPSGPGTLPTHNLLFILVLVSVVLLFGALTFFPALSLGPIVEQLTWGNSNGN